MEEDFNILVSFPPTSFITAVFSPSSFSDKKYRADRISRLIVWEWRPVHHAHKTCETWEKYSSVETGWRVLQHIWMPLGGWGGGKAFKNTSFIFFFYLRQLFQVMLGCCRGCDNCGAPPQKAWQDGALQRIQEGSFNTIAQLASITHCRFNNWLF